jgi:uncharacterized iron-regulated protein
MRLNLAVAILLNVVMTAAAWAGQPPDFITTLESGHPLIGKVWSPASRSFIAADELVRRAAAAEVVILGETHDNPDHHTLQAWILRHLIAAGRRPVVAFEMLDSGQRPALERHLRERPGDDAGLGAAVEWEKTGWPDWALYRPIADAALSAHLPVVTANLTKDESRQIAKGNIPASLPPTLGLDQPLDPAIRQAMEADIKSSHCHMLPDKALPAMVRVQRARDAVMARALADGLASRGTTVLISGAGHARTDRGAPAHLANMAPGRKVFSMAFIEVQGDKAAPAAYAELYDADFLPFDAVWFTPRSQREDQCEAFRRHMEKKKGN